MDISEKLRDIGVIPVISLPSVELALPLAEALLAGGLACAEITFRTAAAAESISRIAARLPEMVLGAGTVLNPDQAAVALDSGAKFIVSPGSNPETISYCQEQDAVIFPGVCTPTEIEINLSRGISTMKFFPAEPAGGVGYLKALCAPFRQVSFIPTGGIDTGNLASYLAINQVVACGGSWMVKPELVSAGDFAAIEKLSKAAVEKVAEIRGK